MQWCLRIECMRAVVPATSTNNTPKRQHDAAVAITQSLRHLGVAVVCRVWVPICIEALLDLCTKPTHGVVATSRPSAPLPALQVCIVVGDKTIVLCMFLATCSSSRTSCTGYCRTRQHECHSIQQSNAADGNMQA